MDRLSSMGLSNAARKYLDAAEILQRHSKGVCMPAYFVACQGLELTLKGYLRGCGLAEKQLRKLGHDLERITDRAFKECPDGLVDLSEPERVIVSLINMYYQDRDLQYTRSEYKELPELSALLEVCERLWRSTRKFCVEKQALHYGLPTAVL